MATVPTGYVFWDVSASKSYTAGKTMPTLGNKDYLVPASSSTSDGYYHQYVYYTSFSECGIEMTNGWNGCVQSAYYSKSSQSAPFSSIGGKPVKFFTYANCQFVTPPNVSGNTSLEAVSFYNCKNMTSTPALPPNIRSLQYSFYHCEKITSPPSLSNLNNPTSIETLNCTFEGCYQLSSAPDLSSLTNLLYMYCTFRYCSALVTPPSLSSCVLLETIANCFEGCTSLVTPSNYYIPDTVVQMQNSFKDCTSIVRGPIIPESATSLYYSFMGCTSLSGFIEMNNENPGNAVDMFKNTVNTIILVGEGATDVIARTGNNDNVYNGISATPLSFTAIRCDASGEESATGTYCLLTVSFKAPYISGAKLIPPILKKDGVISNPTWRWNTKDGTIISSSGIQLQNSGKIISILSLGNNTSSAAFALTLVTTYGSYNPWNSEEINASLTYKEFIMDINPSGTGIAFGKEANDSLNGIDIGMPIKGLGLINFLWPVGSVYMTSDEEFNPNTHFEGTTWVQMVDKMIMAASNLASSERTYQALGTGGEDRVTLSVNEIPAHTHGSSGAHSHASVGRVSGSSTGANIFESYNGASETRAVNVPRSGTNGAHTHTSVGGGLSHNNIPPYIVYVVWRRTE